MREEDENPYDLYAWFGEKSLIHRLAGHLHKSKVVELDYAYMIPFTLRARKAANIPDADHRRASWLFRTVDPETLQQLAGLAGPGRLAYVEAWGYKDWGHALAIGWRDGRLALGPCCDSVPKGLELSDWVYRPDPIDEMAVFLGVYLGQRSAMHVLALDRHHCTEDWRERRVKNVPSLGAGKTVEQIEEELRLKSGAAISDIELRERATCGRALEVRVVHSKNREVVSRSLQTLNQEVARHRPQVLVMNLVGFDTVLGESMLALLVTGHSFMSSIGIKQMPRIIADGQMAEKLREILRVMKLEGIFGGVYPDLETALIETPKKQPL